MQTNAGTNQLTDKMLALDMIKDSKYCILGLAKASTEASHAELREFVDRTLTDCVQDHYQLTDMMMIKGWYHPNNLKEQLQSDFEMVPGGGLK